VTFSAAVTPSAAATASVTKLYFYRYDTKSMRKTVKGRRKTVRVRYWHLRATQPARTGAGGRVSVAYALPRSGSWKVMATFTGSKAYARSNSLSAYFGVR